MGVIEGKVFKAGESGPLRLPEEFDFAPGTMVTIERVGDRVTIKRIDDPEENRRNNAALVAELRAIWADAGGPPPREMRDPDIFPDRPGLY